jgi:hypothetical protein
VPRRQQSPLLRAAAARSRFRYSLKISSQIRFQLEIAPVVHRAHSLSHVKDRIGVWSCIPESNLVQLPFG